MFLLRIHTVKDISRIKWLWLTAALLTSLTLLQDYLYTIRQGSSYYLEESLLFSSFWFLFVPLIAIQWNCLLHLKKQRLIKGLTWVVLSVLVHLLVFSMLVWLISGLFYTHQFEIRQTIWFAITEYLYVLLVVYSIPVIGHGWSSRKRQVLPPPTENPASSYSSTLLVTEGSRKIPVQVKDIWYLEAQTPYVQLHLQGKKYLYKGSLSGLSAQLDPASFIRVHKSFIVQLKAIRHYTSRQNGDYDLVLLNDAVVRLSRNYGAAFRAAFQDKANSTQVS
ncbi:LytTR family DNA-binding domain-containing protein [Flavihumibacter sp. CACIAM 22H1]|uniref:LytR/AlgR family response regulator transcription factor n=1 Tax=Flavihumibacter sp. CACIAM 22H1 TaxID=1812911 RepID=UPI0007A90858|nr:LytTR family DNA-binding domain-containing protein [Flavihumibacter sp. CACIAM 22H1]KYP14382.1 MAG: hypothetical protein A1D16_17745 [Flavihumibacter sp. CACIAM 22H1]